MPRCVVIILTLATLALPARGDDAPPAGANKLCPVMTDQPTKAERFIDFQGKRIFFCCDKCLAKFKNQPQKYLMNLDGTAKPQAAGAARVRFSGKFWQLFGKLHVVVVHFPIALIMIAGIIELFRIRKQSAPSDAAYICLAIGAM